MKVIKKIAVLCFLAGIVFLSSTCGDKRAFFWVIWEGNVYDSIGGNPTPNYWITLKACKYSAIGQNVSKCDFYTVGSCKTDASGYFKIHNQAARTDSYTAFWGNASFTDVKKDNLKNHQTLYIYNH